jgi:hypothetical protein
MAETKEETNAKRRMKRNNPELYYQLKQKAQDERFAAYCKKHKFRLVSSAIKQAE